ncbi:hypothetical protein MVEN_02612300 [Mycena venus]|uniref:TPR-like protein n=1 Tax=Mycena venus TaxID=2733690 RepID=A0A8H6TW52_9AGAR|nr:hypothetical protein MVEN_02612300 [Mycena venus]
MSATSSPGDPTPEQDAGDDNGDAIVVLTPDTATLERALAERAAKRQAIASKKRQAATDRQAFGVTLMKIKNYEGAAGCFADACKLWRANPVAHCDLATAYLHLGRFEDAEASASTALGLDPKLVEARYARAMARKGRGNVRAAIVDLTTVLELAPDNASAQAALRDLQAEQEDPPASTSASDAPATSNKAASASDEAPAAPEPAPSTSEPTASASGAGPSTAPAPAADADADASYAHPLPTSPAAPHLLPLRRRLGVRHLRRAAHRHLAHAVSLLQHLLLRARCALHLLARARPAERARRPGEEQGGAAAGTSGEGADGSHNANANDKSRPKNNSKPKGKSKKGQGPRHTHNNSNSNANVLASVSAQHAALAAELARRMALFNLSMGVAPYEGFGGLSPGGLPAGVGSPGVAAQEGASAGFTEYVPPPRAADATDADGTGAGLSY